MLFKVTESWADDSPWWLDIEPVKNEDAIEAPEDCLIKTNWGLAGHIVWLESFGPAGLIYLE